MTARFLTELDARLVNDDSVWLLRSPLIYDSDIVGRVEAKTGFYTDFASMPRWIPIASNALLGKAHREAVIHDFLYCSDSVPLVTRKQADDVLLEAMEARGKSLAVRYAIYAGVRIGAWPFFHKRKVGDKL